MLFGYASIERVVRLRAIGFGLKGIEIRLRLRLRLLLGHCAEELAETVLLLWLCLLRECGRELLGHLLGRLRNLHLRLHHCLHHRHHLSHLLLHLLEHDRVLLRWIHAQLRHLLLELVHLLHVIHLLHLLLLTWRVLRLRIWRALHFLHKFREWISLGWLRLRWCVADHLRLLLRLL